MAFRPAPGWRTRQLSPNSFENVFYQPGEASLQTSIPELPEGARIVDTNVILRVSSK